jgi:hypothetical protein
LVSDVFSNRLFLCDVNGNIKASTGGSGTGTDQYQAIGQITVDNDGNAYVVDSLNNRIHVYNPDLVQTHLWGTAGVSPGQLSEPRSICYDNGTVVIGDSGRIQRFSLTGVYISSTGSQGTGDNQFSGSPSFLSKNTKEQILAVDPEN